MATFKIRKNGKTINTVIADGADNALDKSGFEFTEIGENDIYDDEGYVVAPDNRVTDIIEHYGLNFLNYGTTYGFDLNSGVVAVREV